MLLDSINGPADLRALSYEQLDELAVDIRQFIVDAIEQAGSGHLGSNLGAVELTLALHRVFDSPRAILPWDTGPQAYVPKTPPRPPAAFTPPPHAGRLSGPPTRP